MCNGRRYKVPAPYTAWAQGSHLPLHDRLEPQTKRRTLVVLAPWPASCIAPDLVMNPKPGLSEKESVSDTRPNAELICSLCMHDSVCLQRIHTRGKRERESHTHMPANQPVREGRPTRCFLSVYQQDGQAASLMGGACAPTIRPLNLHHPSLEVGKI